MGTTALHVCKTVMKRRPERQLNHNMEGFEWEVEAACLINPEEAVASLFYLFCA